MPIFIEEQPRLAFVPTNHHDYQYPVEVRATIDMGNGVFATRDIKKGELCCFYDGIIVTNKIEMGGIISDKLGYEHDYVTQTKGTMVRDEEIREVVEKADTAIAGFTTKLRRGGVGQLINDWSMSYDTYNYEYLKNLNICSQCEQRENTGQRPPPSNSPPPSPGIRPPQVSSHRQEH